MNQDGEEMNTSNVVFAERKFLISGKLGLHARPAASLVQLANQFRSDIKVRKGTEEVDGKSIMGILTLAAGQGAEVVVTARGEDAQEALDRIAELFVSRFGEKE